MRRMLLRSVLSLFLVVVVMASCAPQQAASTEISQAEAPAEEIITLEFWTFADIAQGAGLEYLQSEIAKFQETHPNVRVNITGKNDDDLTASLIASAASGTMPDIFEEGTGNGGTLVKVGALNNIYDRWMGLPQAYRDQFDQSVIDLVSPEEGVMYAVPHTGYAYLMYRNLTVLREAGIDPNEKVVDWDAWLAQMQQIKDAGFVAIPSLGNNLRGIRFMYGGIATDEEWGIDYANSVTKIDPEKYAELGEYLLKTKPYATEAPVLDQSVTDLFISNQLAYYFCGSWCDPTFVAAKENSGLEYDWAIIPGSTQDNPAGVQGYELLAINTKGEHADLAWEFLVHMADKPAMFRLGNELGRYNANGTAMAEVDNPLIAITLEAGKYAIFDAPPFFVEPVPSDYFTILQDNMTAVYSGTMTPQEGAEQLISDLNQTLADRDQ